MISNTQWWVSKAARQPGPSKGGPQTSSMNTPWEHAKNAEPTTGHTLGFPMAICVLTGSPALHLCPGVMGVRLLERLLQMQMPGCTRGLLTWRCGTPAWDLAFQQAPGWVFMHTSVGNHWLTPHSWAAPGPRPGPTDSGCPGWSLGSTRGRRETPSRPEHLEEELPPTHLLVKSPRETPAFISQG